MLESTTNLNSSRPFLFSDSTLWLAASRGMERAAYYGFRAVIVLYMANTLSFDDFKSMEIYGLFTGLITISWIIGALLGDFFFSGKRSIILGGSLQSLGCFVLALPSSISLYIGLGLILIGNGLYSPNLTAHFGRLNAPIPKRLDAAFLLLYFMMNVGAFIGVLAVGMLGEKWGWAWGFILSGLLFIFATLLALKSENIAPNSIEKSSFTWKKNGLLLLFAILLIGIFKGLWQQGVWNIPLYIQRFEMPPSTFIKAIESYTDIIFLVPIGLGLMFFWFYYHYNRFLKIAIAFILAAIAMGLLSMIPEFPSSGYSSVLLLGVLLLVLAELHINPILHSLLTLHVPKKYLATAISLSSIPIGLLTSAGMWLLIKGINYHPDSSYGLWFSGGVLGGLGCILLGVLFYIKKLSKR